MKITDVLSLEMTHSDVHCLSKKRLLESLASIVNTYLGGSQEQSDSLFHRFIAREKLGSTAIGDGVAIPHCRAAGVTRICGCLIKLDKPINFDAFDNEPVDLVFGLIVPEEKNDEHLATLARIASMMQREDSRQLLRECKNNQDLYNTAIALERAN
ncbi:MAG: PTS sugar transporter subunit IIA [Porticoccaceae bacterium]|nr:PTS sugar transporter subunit IIA [Porticoccaceae bacterium]MDG1475134.1 PTS sugar transporter subunit IIA [Porticoccaceae bacterium]